MASKAVTADITTSAKRAKLASDKNPYFVKTGDGRSGLSIGYRRPVSGPGTWSARLIENKRRAEARIGVADDLDETRHAPDGSLSYQDALAATIAWAADVRAGWVREAEATTPADAAPTVKTATEAYVAARAATAAREKNGTDAEYRLGVHVLKDEIANTKLASLSVDAFRKWVKRRPAELALATVQRTVNDLKASLLAYAKMNPDTLPPRWTDMVKGALSLRSWAALRPTAPVGDDDEGEIERQLLTQAEVRAVVGAAFEIGADFGRMVAVLAVTGARFSQVIRIRVRDVDAKPGAGFITIQPSRKGRAGKSRPPQRLPVGDDVLEYLRPVLAGRRGEAPLLERDRKRQISATKWEVESREAWRDAAEMHRDWARARTAAGIDEHVTPYCLRHSRIVEMLKAGIAAQVVANALDTSTTVIDSNYGRFSAASSADALRAALSPVAPATPARLQVVR